MPPADQPPHGDASREDEDRLRSDAEELGLSPPAFRDEQLAPAVDTELLLALIRRQLPVDQAESLYRLIYSFRSWNQAHTKLLVAEFRRTYSDQSLPREQDE